MIIRRKKEVVPVPETLQATVMIQLGLAWRASNEGEPLRAIRHLSIAVEAIMVLIEQWSSKATDVEEEVENGKPLSGL